MNSWSPQARQDLLDIYVAIGFGNADAAERLYTAIEAKVDLLARHPRIGVSRPEIRPTSRVLIEGPYLILYEIHPTVGGTRPILLRSSA
ncbi:MAG: type II toxin-antitoxin system RelE/ParE family toxin [Acidobacteriaceae bacterium]